MRESIGGTMLYYIVAFFMTVFIFFMAAIINYARTYKIKNSLISYIERQEGIEMSEPVIRAELNNLGYSSRLKFQVCKEDLTRGSFYKVKLYAAFEVPIMAISLDLPITGETRNIITGTKVANGDNIKNPNLGLSNVGDACVGQG